MSETRSTPKTPYNNEENHYCVILAGGVGRRFWPYSRRKFPKQFIDFLGTGESMLQMTYRRFREHFEAEKIIVVTNEEYKEIVNEQISELSDDNILLESNLRNTSCAIAYACGHLYARNPEAVVFISPSDHLILKERQFLKYLESALQYTETFDGVLTLGIRPSYPETGYGYIQAIDPNNEGGILREGEFYPVKTFTEKPNKHMAKVLVESGEFYWNSGMFIAKAKTLLHEFKVHLTELYERLFSNTEVWGTLGEQEFVAEVYPYCPNISFDYGVMEKVENARMLLCDIGWSDLGSWSSVYTLSKKDDQDNVTVGNASVILNDSTRNLVMVTKPETLVVLQGIDDVMVVQNKDVLLVCRKGDEHKLKQVVPDAQGLGDKFVD